MSGRDPLAPEDLRASPSPLAGAYAMFAVGERLLLSGHSHQAWPDVALEGVVEAFDDAARDVDAKWERAFAKAGGTLIALQRNPQSGEIERLAASAHRPVHDLSPLNEDLEAMLALLALIDDYVGVSNTNMHLRAGLGRSARVLVPFPSEWRWTFNKERSPWFPEFPLYREDRKSGWAAALRRLSADLESGPRSG